MEIELIFGREFKLNQIIEVIYITEKGYMAIKVGRLYDYSKDYVALDFTDDWSLENTLTISKDKIKRIRLVQDNMWR